MLANFKTDAPKELDKDAIEKETQILLKKIEDLQEKMYAQKKYSLLVIFQGLDASGKDGAAKDVFSGINPFGIGHYAFKKPTENEFAHDFLWRVHPYVPAKGMIQIFNRSHYEDILVPSVEGYYDSKFIDTRYELINHFEQMIQHNDTKILKFFLYNSAENQLMRLTERLNQEDKYWKHNDSDWDVREKRSAYLAVYERIFKACDKPEWIIIPSDKNWYKSYLISKHVLKALEQMNLFWPNLETERF